jgi:hypothetical protein
MKKDHARVLLVVVLMALMIGIVAVPLVLLAKRDAPALVLLNTRAPVSTVTPAPVREVQAHPPSSSLPASVVTPAPVREAPVREVQEQPPYSAPAPVQSVREVQAHPPSSSFAPASRISERLVRLEYECAKCPELGGADQMCCRSCYDNQNLAATRAAPFDRDEYRGTEVLCTGCDAIMKRPTAYCDMSADGIFKCSNGGDCDLEPIKTYEEIGAPGSLGTHRI